MTAFVKSLQEWTGKTTMSVLFDSNENEFTDRSLFDAVKNKPNIALVAVTTDNDVFGAFYSIPVSKQEEELFDGNVFAFSFESHGRCMTPQRFVAMTEQRDEAYVVFCKNDESFERFVLVGLEACGEFSLGNEKSKTFCENVSGAFEEIEDETLTGCNGWESPYHCCRLIALQFE